MAQTDVRKIRPGFLITSEWLGEEGACIHQRTRFGNVHPEGMKITTRNLNTARSKYRLSTGWLIETVLTWEEYSEMAEYAGANPRVVNWEKDNARLFHSAFVRILKERN